MSEKKKEFECLKVTNVQVFPFRNDGFDGKIKGLANIVLNEQLILRSLRIMDGVNGMFVGYPCDPFFKGEEYRSMFSPVTRELREEIENAILEEYAKVLKENG